MTVAMLFLIEAATACGPAAPARLGGEAEVVRAVLDFEEEQFDLPAPTPAAGSPGTDQPASDPAAMQCRVVPTVIA